jgi:hypothetical protein
MNTVQIARASADQRCDLINPIREIRHARINSLLMDDINSVIYKALTLDKHILSP